MQYTLYIGVYYGNYSLTTYKTLFNGDAFFRTTVVPLALMLVINFIVLNAKLRIRPLNFLRGELKKKGKKSVLLSMFIYYIGCYYARRQELYSDEFAIKMGYGNALKSALDKCLNYRAKSNINIGIVTKIMYYVLYVFKSIGFSNYPNNDERLNAIVRKTNSYDTSKNNINRTNNIDYY